MQKEEETCGAQGIQKRSEIKGDELSVHQSDSDAGDDDGGDVFACCFLTREKKRF
jgi:hypothetical protein